MLYVYVTDPNERKMVDGAVTRNTIVIDARERGKWESQISARVGSDDIDVPDDRHLQKDNHQSEKTGPKTKEIIKL